MILLCGIPTETPLAMIHAAAGELGLDVVIFDQREWEQAELELTVQDGTVDGRMRVSGSWLPAGAITGVYTRMMDDQLLPGVRERPAADPLRARCRDLHRLLTEMIDLSDARIINRMTAMASNGSKPLQAQILEECGFMTPPTLITNEPQLVREFLMRHGRVVFKSISGQRSIVTELAGTWLERLEAIRSCPVQFQARVPGTDVRVHVIGEQVVATAVASTATDYRYAHRQGARGPTLQPMALEDTIAQRCIDATGRLGLELAGLDLRLAPGGLTYCFEVNTSPAFSYYEQHTGQPIARHIAQHLAG